MPGKLLHLWTAGLAVCAVSLLGTVRVYADILPGSIWPNGTLENASASPNQLNSPSMNNVVGGPGTWRRGGGDFTPGPNPGPYTFDFWDNVAGTVSGTHALRLNDDSTTGNGEWFVPDFDGDATVVPITPGSILQFHFFWNYATQGDMRVTIRGTDGINNFGLGPSFDFLANGTTGGAFVVADFVRVMPAIVTGIRMNIASGGGGEVTGFLAVDDISVVVVPEPTCLGVVGMAAVTAMSRRRRPAR